MTTQLFRTGLAAIALTAATLLAGPASLAAQTEVKPGEDTGYIAIIKGNDVYVRCGAAESYYTFAKLNDGDMVKVTGEKYEWSRIMPVGPAFSNAFGFIKYAKGDTGRFRLAPDRKSGQTLGKIEIIAPNLDAKNNPKDSWKSLVRLEADQTLRVLETIETDKDIIHKVALPEAAQGWVSTARLEKATPEQARQWPAIVANHTRAMAGGNAGTPPPTGTSTSTKSTTPATPGANKPPSPPSSPPVAATTPSSPQTGATTPPSTGEMSADGMSATESTTTGTADTQTAPPPKPEPKLPTLEDLEAALKNLQKEAIETAEVGPLRELYLDLARRSAGEARIVRYANGRAEQLQVWADIQKKRAELDALRNRAKMSAEEAIAVQQALESSAEYTVVGKVITSTIYDGKNLPQLLRLQDPSTARTVAYLRLDEKYQAVNLIGNLVGIVGDKTYDGSLRLNIIEPRRIDLLLPEASGSTTTVTVPTDQPTPISN